MYTNRPDRSDVLPQKNLGFGFGSGSRPKPKLKNPIKPNPPKKQINFKKNFQPKKKKKIFNQKINEKIYFLT